MNENAAGRRVCWILLALCLIRVWLMALPSSLWVDELVTVFVVRHPGDVSFAVAPQVPLSLYYWLPRASLAMFGSSEIAVRLPSVVAMLCTLFFIGRVATRTIHPAAGWFAIFAAIAFRNFDYFAVDARPYALGMAVASASVLFLVRWFDEGQWGDAAVFVALAGTLWWIHLFYWPFYLLYAGYAGIRLVRRDTAVKAWQVGGAAVLIGCALAPVAMTAVRISREAGAHAFNELPTLRNLFYLAHGFPILIGIAAVWGLGRVLSWKAGRVSGSGFALAIMWWLVCPVCLFVYSRLSGNGVLIIRYASLMLPGIALTATAIMGWFLPPAKWRAAALVMGMAGLALTGDWKHLWPAHENSDWRDAAARERAVASDDTPVLCPSPFVEAQLSTWRPEYPIASFLYSHLQYYAVKGRLKPLPFLPSAESERYLDGLLRSDLLPAGHFVEYGSTRKVEALDLWVARQPELAGWHRAGREFDNLSVVIYRR